MDEKKTYSVIGTVTIGTDEYRDLIENLKDAQNEVEKRRSEWWEQYNKANERDKELKATIEKLNMLEAFVNSDEALKAKFKLWRIENEMDKEIYNAC